MLQLQQVWSQLNWFRIHLLAFVFVPLFFSGLFAAANPSKISGEYRTGYLDALFMCYSAMTSTGLNVVSVSALQPAQQGFLFVLMIIGDISVVNLITIACRQVVDSTILRDLHSKHRHSEDSGEPGIAIDSDAEGQNGNQTGNGDENGHGNGNGDGNGRGNGNKSHEEELDGEKQKDSDKQTDGFRRRHQLRGKRSRPDPPSDPHKSVPHASSGKTRHTGRGGFPGIDQLLFRLLGRIFPSGLDWLRKYEDEGLHSSHPVKSFGKSVEKTIGRFKDSKEQKTAKHAKWLPPGVLAVVVGRNSQFFEEELSDDDLELLGVLEYRATTVLTVLLVVHQLLWILLPSAIIAIYLVKVHIWDTNFLANGSSQSGTTSTTWFTFYQVVSAYSSCGLSLVDELMLPFQNCYLLIYVLLFPMLSGNQALPLFLRWEVWLLSKIVREGSELEVSLHFILTHSRRFFLYLFPAYQSWYLFAVEWFLMSMGTILFILFDRGLSYYGELGDGWEKFSVGFFQSVSARASGFDIVHLSDLAPAIIFFYLVLMFTSNYPLVMAIRSTNVYEERALGLNGEHAPGKDNQSGEVFSKYLKQHLLPQIYFDLWPVILGAIAICVVERAQMMDSNNTGWLGIFQILFEVTSGYGTVGLGYGNPFNTSSLSGTFRKLSKIIMILLMLRGRHRGLPLAIDRATMFPIEYQRLGSGERKHLEEDRVGQAGEEADNE